MPGISSWKLLPLCLLRRGKGEVFSCMQKNCINHFETKYSAMKRHLPVLLAFFWAIPFTWTQNCIPGSSIALEREAATTANIQAKIQEVRKLNYYPKDVEEVKQMMLDCNVNMNRRLNDIERKIKEYSNIRKDAFGYRDNEGFEKQRLDLVEARRKVKEDFKKDFKREKRKGLFAVLIKDLPEIPPSTDSLKHTARNILLPVAVRFLNGEYITRLSSMRDYTLLKDAIESFSDGKMEEIDNFNSRPNYQRRYFLYIGEVSITHLDERIGSNDYNGYFKGKVLNFETEDNYAGILKAEGVSDADIERIRTEIIDHLLSIRSDNKAAEAAHFEYLETANKKIRQLDAEIEEIENKIKYRSKNINEICQKVGIPFDASNATKSAENALLTIDQQIKGLSNEWNKVKEQELLYSESKPFYIDKDPVLDVSKKAKELIDALNADKGQTNGLEMYTRVEDGTLVENTSKYKTMIFRSIDRVWIYPVPGDDNSYKIHVFAKFNITKQSIPTEEESKRSKEDMASKGKLEQSRRDSLAAVARQDSIQAQRAFELNRIRLENERAQQLAREQKKQERRERRSEFWENTTSGINGVSSQGQWNKYYKSVDIGPRWNFGNEYSLFSMGVSAGGYWKKGEYGGFLLQINTNYFYQLTEDGPLYIMVGVNPKFGLGNKSFIGVQPAVGAMFGTSNVGLYLSIGPDITTLGKAFAFQMGILFHNE